MDMSISFCHSNFRIPTRVTQWNGSTITPGAAVVAESPAEPKRKPVIELPVTALTKTLEEMFVFVLVATFAAFRTRKFAYFHPMR